MASKLQIITELANDKLLEITDNYKNWTGFLDSATWNYKYKFQEQVLIYGQKPNATACAPIELWNKLDRWVNKGAKGIALLDDKNSQYKIRYVFDVSDTNNRYGRTIKLWEMNDNFENGIVEALENSFGDIENKNNLARILIDTAKNTVDDNYNDYLSNLGSVKSESLIEELDTISTEVWFKTLTTNSVSYILLKRCGINPDMYFNAEDFNKVSDFNTAETISVLGDATSDISEMILQEIEVTVKILQKTEIRTIAENQQNYYDINNNKSERSFNNDTNVYNAGRLSNSQPDSAGNAVNREIWNTSSDLSSGTQERDLRGVIDIGETEQTSFGDRQTGKRTDGTNDVTDGEITGSDTTTKSNRPVKVGSDDEQYQEFSGGNSSESVDLQLNLPSVAQQQNIIEKVEVDKTSAFVISQEDIDAVLQLGSGVEHGKFRIYLQYLQKKSQAENATFLRDEYGWGGAYPAVSEKNLDEGHDGKGIKISRGSIMQPDAEMTLLWNSVSKRIDELITADRYLNAKEKKFLPVYLKNQEDIAKRGEIADELRSVVRDYNDYQTQLGNQDNLLNQYVLVSCASSFQYGERHTYAGKANGELVLPLMKQALNDIIKEKTHLTERADNLLSLLDSDIVKPFDATYDELNPPPEPKKEYRFTLGDTVFLGASEYEVLSYNDEMVRLFDNTFPIINKEIPRLEFNEKLKENPLNNHLLQVIEEEKNEISTKIIDPIQIKLPVENPALAETLAPPKPKREKAQSFDLHPEISQSERNNFCITNDELGYGTASEKYENNVCAVKVLKQIESENRFATPDEQEILSKYVGWGGLSAYFDEKNSKFGELNSLLDETEYSNARESSLTAFYTSPVIIRSMYKVLENMGQRDVASNSRLTAYNILEPSCGIGNFLGMLPDNMAESKLYGVELDSISGRIAQQLYQKSSIAAQGYEKTNLPDSFFDIAIGNVPFGQFKVADKKYDKNNFLIHDYFFSKTLDKVRPGGIIAFITSKGTLDKENPAVRKYIAQRADLLGAIRLPNNAFKANAGTEVTSDIIFLQKRDRLIDIEPDWVHLNTNENGIKMNQYFIDNPEMIMGEMVMESTQYGMDSTCKPIENISLVEMLNDAIANVHAEVTEYEFDDLSDEEDLAIPADPNVRNFSYTLVDGKIYYRVNSKMNPAQVSVTAENRIKSMIQIRDCVRTLIEYQTEDYSDDDIKSEQDNLNRLYDTFIKKYGLINSRPNSMSFSEDSSYCLLCSLEEIDENGELLKKADMFSKRTIKQHTVVTSVDTASEAIAVSLSEKAKVDMEYMCILTGKTEHEIFEELKGVIFINPLFGYGNETEQKFLPADEYLSGNVREKLVVAKKSAELYPLDYSENVKALEAVQPVNLTASEIAVRLGATWISPEIVRQFMFEIFSTPRYSQWNIKVHYSPLTSEWNIEGKNIDRVNIKAYNAYGTNRINGYKIIEETLNLKDVRIFEYVEDSDGKKQQILNKKETAFAQGKQELIKNAFAEWIWADPERREKLCKLYNEKFNSQRPREYDGSHIKFSGMNPEISLRPHQVNAIAHILYGGNTLLAHVVGAGKTYEMVAAAQESKRLGLCQKSLFVVPNHLTEQWSSEYLQLYPSANILVATKKDFETKNRKKFCGRIATGDYDAVIIGHSQFEKIPMSIERQQAILQQQLDEVIDGISELKRNRGDNFSVKQLEKTKKSIKLKLDKLNDQTRKDDVVTFEELGCDRIFVDEAHNFKNLFLFTKMRNVGGIAQTEAQKSSDLFMKCRYLDEITGGRGTVFATGTPISNSMTELYTMQRYLQYNALQKKDLQHFDSWASTFGETVTAIELSPEGTGYRAKTRFAKFYNLPELMSMFKDVADIQTADMLNLPVPKANYHNVVLKPTEQQKEMVLSLSERAEKVRNKMIDSAIDNMLVVTNDGRKLALDQRLINEMLPDDENNKSSKCAENVYEIWENTKAQRSTQMIFCDLSTPHYDGSFNVYDDIKKKLMDKGIQKEEIAFIHVANTEIQKKELFAKVRNGQIRVLLGSTAKMGAGTNVQNKLVALHHLDCPWRPSDLQQREGRIIRQGNENLEVDIFSYVTENTFDAYLYQLVENKQKFISQIMTSKSPVRCAEDIDETALSYAEIKALATGNPHIKEKMDLDIDVLRLKLLKANHLSQKYALEDQIIKVIPQQIKSNEERIKGYKADISKLSEYTKPNTDGFSPMIINGIMYTDKKEAGTAIIDTCKKMTIPDPVLIGQYRGFSMELYFDTFSKEYKITLKNQLRHTTSLGTDIFGNIQRLDNTLEAFSSKLITCEEMLENSKIQLSNAKIEVDKHFPKEEELKTKSARLDELNILLNMDHKDNEIVDGELNDCNVVDIKKEMKKDFER